MPGPIGIYVRVSARGGRDDERFHSPREQTDRARGLCASRGHTPGPVFEDIDVSGATHPDDRPAMSRLLAGIRSGELGGMAAYSLDRLSREPAHGDALVREITGHGGVILTPDIPDAIDTPTGEFTFGMLLQVAKLYRSTAAARFEAAKAGAIARGVPVTNRPAVGYIRGDDRRYHPDPDVAPTIREVFECRARGAGPTELAELLESRGVTTSQGSTTWSKAAVQGLIRSRTYLGEIRSGPHVNTEAHEPLVDEPLWLAAQHPTPAPARRPSRGGYLLAGIVRCASCLYTLQGTTTSRGKRIYRCGRRHSAGICTNPTRIRADVLEGAVVAELKARATAPVHAGDTGDVAPLRDALDVAERRLAQVMTDEARDALGPLWAPDVKARREARDEAARILGDAQTRHTPTIAVDLIEHWDDGPDIGDRAATVIMDLETRRRILTAVFPAILVARDGALTLDVDPATLPRRGYRRLPKD